MSPRRPTKSVLLTICERENLLTRQAAWRAAFEGVRPSLWVNYPAETGIDNRHWPRELRVERGGIGRVDHLLRAVLGDAPALPHHDHWLRRELDRFPLAYPALRCLGRANIAQALELDDEKQVSHNLATNPDYAFCIRRVGWLHVAELPALMELALSEKRRIEVIRSLAKAPDLPSEEFLAAFQRHVLKIANAR